MTSIATTRPLVLRVVRVTRQHAIGSDGRTEFLSLYWEGGEVGLDAAPALHRDVSTAVGASNAVRVLP